MLIGYLSYKKKWISDDTSSQISGLIVNIFNPALIISGVIGSVGNGNWNLVIMESGIAAFPKYCTKLTAGAGASI